MDRPVKTGSGSSKTPSTATTTSARTNKHIRCFSCGQPGHIAIHCRANTMFCEQTEDFFGADIGEGVVHQGLGVSVKILLDIGSARTLVRSDLVLAIKACNPDIPSLSPWEKVSDHQSLEWLHCMTLIRDPPTLIYLLDLSFVRYSI